MFIRRSTYTTLVTRVQTYRVAEQQARTMAAALVGSATRASLMEHRLRRAVLVIVRLRHERAALERQLAALQFRYDTAVGLDSPALDEGARWQERRPDKPQAVAS